MANSPKCHKTVGTTKNRLTVASRNLLSLLACIFLKQVQSQLAVVSILDQSVFLGSLAFNPDLTRGPWLAVAGMDHLLSLS